MKMKSRQQSISAIKNGLVGGDPLVAIETWEEDQAIIVLQSFAKSAFAEKGCFISWDLQNGLTGTDTSYENDNNICSALEHIENIKEPGFYVFKDLCHFIKDPEVQRRLKSIAKSFRGSNRFLFFTATEILIPNELRKDINIIRFLLPDLDDISNLLDEYLSTYRSKSIEVRIDTAVKSQIIAALKGLTESEIIHALNRVCRGKKVIDSEICIALQEEKEQLAKKEGVLEYVRSTEKIEDIGGLENLKEWLKKRKALFTPDAAKAGIRPPRGLLMMGISGCGKSLSVKAIATLWGLPLFRLDMNKVYSGIHGSPEGTFHRAIKSVEAVAPAILWIDEIEGGISSSTAKDGSTGSHIFSAFLTWMQEKSSDVFVAATANRIDLLPAEIIRKGRFDQVFFIDLPNDTEREAIFRGHLSKRGIDTRLFDLSMLSVATEFWNGAEIEHVVESAMIEAFARNEKLTQDDLYTIIRSTVPLSRTMSEQIKFIKNWASERAISASKKDEEE